MHNLYENLLSSQNQGLNETPNFLVYKSDVEKKDHLPNITVTCYLANHLPDITVTCNLANNLPDITVTYNLTSAIMTDNLS